MLLNMADNISLYVKQVGNGTPCLYIHGGPGGWSYDFEVFAGSYLEDFMNVVYFDQRGCGRSTGGNNDNYSIDRIIEDIEEIRKRLRIKRWYVLAHSFGGIIAVNYVNKYEEFVEGLILLNSTLNMEDSLKSQIYHGSQLLDEEAIYQNNSNSIMEKWQYVFKQLIDKDLFYNLQYEDYNNYLLLNNLNSEIENINLSMASQAFSNKEYFSSYYDVTENINIPVLIVAGSKDYAIGCKHYKNFLFPNSQIKVIHGKHVLYIENKEEFLGAVRKFIESKSELSDKNIKYIRDNNIK